MKKIFSAESIPYFVAIFSIIFILWMIYPVKDESKKFYDATLGTSFYKEKPEVTEAKTKYYECSKSIDDKYYPKTDFNKNLNKIANFTVDDVLEDRRLKEEYCKELIEKCNDTRDSGNTFAMSFKSCLQMEGN